MRYLPRRPSGLLPLYRKVLCGTKFPLVSHPFPCHNRDMKKTKRQPAAKSQEKPEVLVNVILDRSGSMQSTRAGTISGFNEYLNGLRADTKTEYGVSLIQFDAPNEGPELTVTWADKPLADIKELGDGDYAPRGMTPLYDAIGECIRRVDAKGRPVIAVIITDGLENASKEFTRESVKALIKQKEGEGWGFVFLGANIDSVAVGGSIGILAQNAYNYTAGNEKALYSNLAWSTVMRSANIQQHGAQMAATMAFMDNSQRSTLMGKPGMQGGRPAAPPRFPSPGVRDDKKRTEWAVRG